MLVNDNKNNRKTIMILTATATTKSRKMVSVIVMVIVKMMRNCEEAPAVHSAALPVPCHPTSQSFQKPLTKEHTLNYDKNIALGLFLN